MAGRRRTVEVFTLSFLDCICCGFGAVILFYTIISAQAGMQNFRTADDLHAEVNRLEEEVSSGTRGLAALRNEVVQTDTRRANDEARTRTIASMIETRREQISTAAASTVAQRQHIEMLKADIRSLEDGRKRLEAGSLDRTPPGQQVNSFRDVGGDRHYITGIRMRGKRILILVDASASMLHGDLVSILRLRNADDAQKRAAAKWRRAVDTVSWLATQVPPTSEFQIYAFNTRAQAVAPDSTGKWISAGDVAELAHALTSLRALVPADGTSLYNAFAAARTLSPLPDQIVLITDGLPTQGRTAGSHRYVDSAARMRLFDEALAQVPGGVPVDTILLPMQGDLQAPHRFWNLARQSGGTLLMPSKDWP
ncbi:MAG TPA: vWA domain-containing protein [Steroidobacteraceae bacterium]|jgi:hypothetical protein